MREGPLEDAFAEISAAVVRPVGSEFFNLVEASRLARRLAAIYRPLYVIANSIETRPFVPAFANQGVPVVALVHEFSSTTNAGTLHLLYERVTEIIFPAEVVRRSSESDYPFLRLRQTHILPQGPSEVPRSRVPGSDLNQADAERVIRSRLRPDKARDYLVVIGMGFVEWRKGIDLFIAAATAIIAREPKAPVRFIWIGHGYHPQAPMHCSSFLSEQITRSSLRDHFDLK